MISHVKLVKFSSTKTFTQTTINGKTKLYQIEYKMTENGIFSFYAYLILKGKSNKKQMTEKNFSILCFE